MNVIKVAGKFLDQPLLVAKFDKIVPFALTAGGALYCAHEVKHAPEEKKKRVALKTGITMGATILSALAAPWFVNKVFERPTSSLKSIKENNSKLVDEFVSKTNLDTKTKSVIEKVKEKVLGYKDIKFLSENLNKTPEGRDLFNKLIPDPENITSKEIFSEISRLSFLGLIPVVGGILGGISADALTTDDWKDKIPNKIKEGTYQYLANIFLCNVGAGIALGIMEKCGIKSKSGRALGMIGGILAMGVIGGSAIANFIGNKFINPIFHQKSEKGLYNERRPEPLDIGLHVDDIATVAVMSGLKWIEPALPVMYSISGYRAGIGYRNKNVTNCKEKNNS